MRFALQRGEPVADGVHRVLDELIGDAIAALGNGDEPATAVHRARKATKRARAVARLVRPSVGPGAYRKLNTLARDAARLLAAERDAHVVLASFDAVVATATDPAVYDDLRAQLPTGGATPSPETLAAALQTLETLRSRTQRLRLRTSGWDALGEGLQNVYRQGAQAMSTAAGKTTAAHLHEWRKQAKYLWHATELLTPAWPAVLGPFGEELHALSSSLGDEHDLDVVSIVVDREHAAVPAGWPALLQGRRSQLRAAAFSRGLRLYAERPGAFARRIRSYYDAWLAG